MPNSVLVKTNYQGEDEDEKDSTVDYEPHQLNVLHDCDIGQDQYEKDTHDHPLAIADSKK